MVRPGSHRFVAEHLDDPAFRQRMLDQDFNDMPGIAEPVEALVPAGGVVFFHSFLVHDRSENMLELPRRVLFVHFKGYDDPDQMKAAKATAAKRFRDGHIEVMDARTKQICGLD
ncbi:MAG: hypothetical protein CMJ49_02420 [Planctomycetaceae bacterium]|nr:hypothetical protein [Planctomycetaceae bacterium]